MTTDTSSMNDPYLSSIKSSLSASAVLKAELATLKSSCENSKVFAYEGVSDKVIYAHWISKIEPNLNYEPFVCNNKNQLLQLFKSLSEDLTGMNENVYFFTDRDFDDLKGHAANESIFMTDKYSVENYLVDTEILNDLLKIEFHCHGNPEVRNNVISLFESKYDDFLDKTSETNFRIFLARKCNIKQIGELTIRLIDLAKIELFSIEPGSGQIELIVPLEREPSDAEIEEHALAFQQLDRRARYRGKFALQFFMRWLNLLLSDRNSGKSEIFVGLPQSDLVAKGSFSFDMLAAKSKPPQLFRDFLNAIKQKETINLAAA